MRALRVVAIPDPIPEPEDELRDIIPELVEARLVLARLERALGYQCKRLAAKRGVAFIRAEHVMREFA